MILETQVISRNVRPKYFVLLSQNNITGNVSKYPLPQALLSVHKSGEENKTWSIIDWGASASSRCVKYDGMNPIMHINFHKERGLNSQGVFWQREYFVLLIRSESDLYESIRLGRD
jgi:hypothetical protein